MIYFQRAFNPKTLINYYFLLFLLFFTSINSTLLVSAISANENEQVMCNEQYSLTAPIFIEEEEIGLIWITPNEDSKMFLLDLKGLMEILEPLLEKNVFLKLKKYSEKNSCITLSNLNSFNLQCKYDENLLTINLIIPPENRKKNILNLSMNNSQKDPAVVSNDNESDNESNIENPSNEYEFASDRNNINNNNTSNNNFTSFYLNTNVGRIYNNEKRYTRYDESNSFFSNFQFVGNVKKFILESNHEYFEQREHNWIRANSRLIHDDRKNLIRYILGDTDYPLAGFQSTIPGAGIAVFKEYSTNGANLLRGNSINASHPKTSFVLKRNSVIEIYLNDNLIDKKTLPAGPFDLTNVPFASGENNLILKIIDNLGNVEIINLSQFYHGEILPADKSEFLMSYDFPSYIEDYKKKYNTKNGKGTFFYRYGLGNKLNLGGNFEFNKKDFLLGNEYKFLTPLALISLDLAISLSPRRFDENINYVSNDKKEYGFALKLNINSFEKWNKKDAPFLWRTSLRVQDSFFKSVGESRSYLRYLIDFYVIKRFKDISLGSGIAYQDNHSSKCDDLSFKFDLSKSFSREFNGGINYTHELKSENKEKRLIFMLTWIESKGTMQANSSYNNHDKSLAGQVQHRYTKGNESLSSALLYNENNYQKNVAADLNYIATRFESKVGHLISKNKNNYIGSSANSKTTRQSGELSLRFALAYANSIFAVGRPISESFAIIKTNPAPKKYSIPINRSHNFSISEIDYFGPALVSSLKPYAKENLFLDNAEIPIGENLQYENIVIVNSFKSGVGITIPMTKKISIVAFIKDNQDKPLVLKTGKVIDYNDDKKIIAEFFSNREGRIFIDEIPSDDSSANQKYKLIIDDERYLPLEINLEKSNYEVDNKNENKDDKENVNDNNSNNNKSFDLGTLIFNKNE